MHQHIQYNRRSLPPHSLFPFFFLTYACAAARAAACAAARAAARAATRAIALALVHSATLAHTFTHFHSLSHSLSCVPFLSQSRSSFSHFPVSRILSCLLSIFSIIHFPLSLSATSALSPPSSVHLSLLSLSALPTPSPTPSFRSPTPTPSPARSILFLSIQFCVFVDCRVLAAARLAERRRTFCILSQAGRCTQTILVIYSLVINLMTICHFIIFVKTASHSGKSEV